MVLSREIGRAASLIDVLDRILDKGIVIDAWIRVSFAGIDLLSVEARAVIASLETYLNYADTLALSRLVSAPPLTVSSELEHRCKEYELPTHPPAFAVRTSSQQSFPGAKLGRRRH